MTFQRISIFIDGRNFYHSTKNIKKRGYEIELQKIINEFKVIFKIVNKK